MEAEEGVCMRERERESERESHKERDSQGERGCEGYQMERRWKSRAGFLEVMSLMEEGVVRTGSEQETVSVSKRSPGINPGTGSQLPPYCRAVGW